MADSIRERDHGGGLDAARQQAMASWGGYVHYLAEGEG